jgi:hypothetical protein
MSPPRSAALASPADGPTDTVVLHVGGLHWAGSTHGVENALSRRPGVRRVEADAVDVGIQPIVAVDALLLKRLRLPAPAADRSVQDV